MEQTILEFIKAILGIDDTNTAFDEHILMLINAAVSILIQLGLDMFDGVVVSADTLWPDFGPTNTVASTLTKSYISQKVRVEFDPPQNKTVLDSTKGFVNELESRLAIVFGDKPGV